MERETRLELATICLEGRGSSQLSYSRTYLKHGGERRTRTFEARGERFTISWIWPLSNLPVEKLLIWSSADHLRLTLDNKKMELMKGVEPPTCWLQISCSSQLSYISTKINMVARDRIELSTQGFSVLCSTDWATEPIKFWFEIIVINHLNLT